MIERKMNERADTRNSKSLAQHEKRKAEAKEEKAAKCARVEHDDDDEQ